MPGAQRALVDLRVGGGVDDRAHRGGRGDLVDGADERQHRELDVGERDEPVLDREAAEQHAVVDDELAHEVRERRPRPGDPAVGLQEAALALTRQQRVAVVQRHHELHLLARGLHGIHQPEAQARGPGRQRLPAERAGDRAGAAPDHLLGDPERDRAARVDRAAEGDQRGQALAATVGGRLVAEHPALAVAAEVHVAAGELADLVDGGADGDDVVGEVALEPALLVLGRRRSPRRTGRCRARAACAPRWTSARRPRPRPRASSAARAAPAGRRCRPR